MAVLPFLATASTCRGDSQWGRRQRFGLVNHLHCTTAASLATVKSRVQAGWRGCKQRQPSAPPLPRQGTALRRALSKVANRPDKQVCTKTHISEGHSLAALLCICLAGADGKRIAALLSGGRHLKRKCG